MKMCPCHYEHIESRIAGILKAALQEGRRQEDSLAADALESSDLRSDPHNTCKKNPQVIRASTCNPALRGQKQWGPWGCSSASFASSGSWREVIITPDTDLEAVLAGSDSLLIKGRVGSPVCETE